MRACGTAERVARAGRPGRPDAAAAARRGCRCVRGGRPLKRWRWVGAFGPDADAVRGARARSAACRSSWWAVWDGERAARAHAPRAAGPVRMAPGRVRVRRRARAARSRRASGVEVVSPHGAQHIWTRKQRRRARARHACSGRAVRRCRGLVDESAGYHARRTAWRWSAGVGRRRVGRAGGVEPRRRPARRAAARPSARCGSTASRTRSTPLPFARPLARRRPALRRVAARAHRENLLLLRLRLRAAVRRASAGSLPGRRRAARGLGRDGAPRGAVVALCKSIQGSCAAAS